VTYRNTTPCEPKCQNTMGKCSNQSRIGSGICKRYQQLKRHREHFSNRAWRQWKVDQILHALHSTNHANRKNLIAQQVLSTLDVGVAWCGVAWCGVVWHTSSTIVGKCIATRDSAVRTSRIYEPSASGISALQILSAWMHVVYNANSRGPTWLEGKVERKALRKMPTI
jgi:hypothetical protein